MCLCRRARAGLAEQKSCAAHPGSPHSMSAAAAVAGEYINKHHVASSVLLSFQGTFALKLSVVLSSSFFF